VPVRRGYCFTLCIIEFVQQVGNIHLK
jgi:hypothetical protein